MSDHQKAMLLIAEIGTYAQMKRRAAVRLSDPVLRDLFETDAKFMEGTIAKIHSLFPLARAEEGAGS